jgi:hypothetical protein
MKKPHICGIFCQIIRSSAFPALGLSDDNVAKEFEPNDFNKTRKSASCSDLIQLCLIYGKCSVSHLFIQG